MGVVNLFRIGLVPPLLSHFVVFIATITVIFDIIHFTALPMKIPYERVLFAIKRNRVQADVISVGDDLVVIRKENGSKDLCQEEGTRATVVQDQEQIILSLQFRGVREIKIREHLNWAPYDANRRVCKGGWSVQYG